MSQDHHRHNLSSAKALWEFQIDPLPDVYTTGLTKIPYNKRGELLLRRSAVYLAGDNAIKAVSEVNSLIKQYGWASQVGAYGALVGTLAVARSEGEEASKKFVQEALSKCNPNLWPFDILRRIGGPRTQAGRSGSSWQDAESEVAWGYGELLAGRTADAKQLLELARPCAAPGSPLRTIADGALFQLGVDPTSLPACQAVDQLYHSGSRLGPCFTSTWHAMHLLCLPRNYLDLGLPRLLTFELTPSNR